MVVCSSFHPRYPPLWTVPSGYGFLLLMLQAASRCLQGLYLSYPLLFPFSLPCLLGKGAPLVSVRWPFLPPCLGYSKGSSNKLHKQCAQVLEHQDPAVTSSNWNTGVSVKFKPLPDWLGGIIVHAFKTGKSEHVNSDEKSKAITCEQNSESWPPVPQAVPPSPYGCSDP